jgi:hypothetical protein
LALAATLGCRSWRSLSHQSKKRIVAAWLLVEAAAWFGTDCRPPRYFGAMQRRLTMELIFPIRDEPSARLMSLKAKCLHQAGVISAREERAVLGRAAKALTASACMRAVSGQRKTAAYAA